MRGRRADRDPAAGPQHHARAAGGHGARAIPLGRAGQPEDRLGAFLFLATDALSGFITGATIDVNGGAYLS
jgi:NAD(P)-dependent dehydrogenase (short-subunit alcohol dehydrogenase family)